MAVVKPVIREYKKNQKGECVVYILYTHHGQTMYFSTQRKVLPSDWDKERNRVKSGDRKAAHNKIITNKVKVVYDIVDDLEIKDIDPTVEEVSRIWKAKRQTRKQTSKTKSLLEYFGTDFIQDKQSGEGVKKNRPVSPGTIKQYGSTLSILIAFQADKKYELTFDSINDGFFVKMVDYLRHEHKFKRSKNSKKNRNGAFR